MTASSSAFAHEPADATRRRQQGRQEQKQVIQEPPDPRRVRQSRRFEKGDRRDGDGNGR